MKYIFLDTNIFLHSKPLDNINWLKICQDEKCEIIIAPIVIYELDKSKVNNDNKGRRARNALHKIENCIDKNSFGIRKNVDLHVIDHKPQKNIFKNHGLNYEDHDDHLLASIIDFKIQQKVDVYLCSYDVGPRIRSKQFGIKTIKIPDEYILPEEDRANEKKLKSLTQEITLLKSRIPRPQILFENGETFSK